MPTQIGLTCAQVLVSYRSAGASPQRSHSTVARKLLIITQLEEYNYAGAAAIACVMLLISFAVLLALNLLQHWQARRLG